MTILSAFTSPDAFVPPTRAKTSLIEPGLPGLPGYPYSPNFNRESVAPDPASRRMPAILTPSTFKTSIAALPFVGIKVAIPKPRITVLACVTLMESDKL